MDAPTHHAIARRRRYGCAALLLIAGFAQQALAQPVYRCVDAEGRVAYQDRACAGTQHETRVELAPAPPSTDSPDYGIEARASRTPQRAAARPASRRAAVMSYECRADNGEVFYRHSGCPGSIRVDAAQARTARGGKASESARVSAVRVPRGDACRRLAAAGSIGRAGHARDEQMSTYDRNAGRDPCRRH